ncbi:MAG: CPBP family intramembrane glutamic endopeptidase [Promethearchaeota archaeon]
MRLKFLVPYVAFILTACIVLFLDFGLIIPLSEKDGALYDYFPQGIYIMPIIWLVIMCFPILYIMLYEEKLFNLPKEKPKRNLKVFIFSFLGLFILIMIFRTLIIWKYNGPYEKMSMIFFLLFQILLVEQLSLKDYGLDIRAPWEDWKRDFEYIGIFFAIIIIFLIPIFILAFFIFYPQISEILPQLTAPNALILISFPFQTIAVGVSEELMFRGYLQENFREFDKKFEYKSHFYFWTFINSFIFGCFHIPWYIEYSPTTFFTIPPENIIPMITRIISTGTFGFFMCLIYEYTRSLRITILLHGLYNTIGAFIGSAFLFVDFDIVNTITNLQLIVFGICLIPFAFIGLILYFKIPNYIADKLNYQHTSSKLKKIIN